MTAPTVGVGVTVGVAVTVTVTGAVLGAVAALYLIPEKNVGVAVMINSEDGASRRAVAFHVLDHYLGLPDQDWNVKLKSIVDGMMAEGEKQMKASPEQVKPNDKSSLPIASYAGVYSDPWYGTATISSRLSGPKWCAAMMRWRS